MRSEGGIQPSILHVDMDAFFASIELQAHPYLKGQPLVVGGQPDLRGVVAAASYEARAFGIHSAMTMKEAIVKCPKLKIVPSRIKLYRRISNRVMQLLQSFSRQVEVVSIDEAYVDVTDCRRDSVELAVAIRARIKDELGLTCSIGVASSKVVAKIASSMHKPNQIFCVPAGAEMNFLAPLPVEVIPGVGPRMKDRLLALNIHLIGQLQQLDLDELIYRHGAQGYRLFYTCRGIDRRPVLSQREPAKSVGAETTFGQNSADANFLEQQLFLQLQKAHTRLMNYHLRTQCVSIKLRSADFTTVTRSHSFTTQTQELSVLWKEVQNLFREAFQLSRPLRLVGVSLEKLSSGYWQPDLFETYLTR